MPQVQLSPRDFVPFGRLPGKPADTVPRCIEILNELIEHAQREANCALYERTRASIIAQRDALTEAKKRIRDGEVDPAWVVRSILV